MKERFWLAVDVMAVVVVATLLLMGIVGGMIDWWQ